ncbi:MAG TPA: hypothetical protein VHR66_05015 [Gemmataceae bacterium]|nr:hypothetical protein [Gemmataceae bacterium]
MRAWELPTVSPTVDPLVIANSGGQTSLINANGGLRVVRTDPNGNLKLWDPSKDEIGALQFPELTGPNFAIHRVSANNRFVMTKAPRVSARLHDLNDPGRPPVHLDETWGRLGDGPVFVTGDGRYIAAPFATSDLNSVLLWDRGVEGRKDVNAIWVKNARDEQVLGFAPTPNEMTLVTAQSGRASSVKLWSPAQLAEREDAKPIRTIEWEAKGPLFSFAPFMSPDGKSLIVFDPNPKWDERPDRGPYFQDLTTGVNHRLERFQELLGLIDLQQLRMSGDSRWLFAPDAVSKRYFFWDLAHEGKVIEIGLGEKSLAIGTGRSPFTISPDSRWLVFAGGKTIKLWDTATLKHDQDNVPSTLTSPHSIIWADFSLDSGSLVTVGTVVGESGERKTAQIWDLRRDRDLAGSGPDVTVDGVRENPNAAFMSHDRWLVLSGNNVQLWDAQAPQQPAAVMPLPNNLTKPAFFVDPLGTRVVAVDDATNWIAVYRRSTDGLTPGRQLMKLAEGAAIRNLTLEEWRDVFSVKDEAYRSTFPWLDRAQTTTAPRPPMINSMLR